MSTAPRRLALVITELEPGGAERMLVELALRLDRERFSPRVYSLASEPSRRLLVDQLEAAQVPTHFLGVERATQYLTAVRQLAASFREHQIEVAQSFLFHANIVMARAAMAAGVKRLATGIRVADPRGWRNALERLATSRADRYVCVSQSVAEFLRRRSFQSEKLVVIPNGVELQRWKNAQAADLSQIGIAASRQALLFVGRLDSQKGIDRFLCELPALFRALPAHDLLVVGRGPLEQQLQRMASGMAIHERVHFVGWRENIPALMQASAMLVLPSLWEGMPNVVLEAMAAGKPVVATQSEGTVELLGLGALAQTVPVGDWAGFRSLVIEIATDATLAAKLSQQNQQRAEQFSLKRVAERYERLYESLLAEKKLRQTTAP